MIWQQGCFGLVIYTTPDERQLKIHLPFPVCASFMARQPIQETPLQELRWQKLSADLQSNVSKTDLQWKILVGRMSLSMMNK